MSLDAIIECTRSGLDIFLPRHPEEDNIDKTCPDPSDINITREILFSLGSPNFTISGFSSRLESVLNWMKVKSCILCRRN